MLLDQGSFRDPSGQVFESGGRIFRQVTEAGRANYEAARDAGIYTRYQTSGKTISVKELPRSEWPRAVNAAAYVLEHSRVPIVTYPYEWSFLALQAAALHHLDLQIELLAEGFTLSDASAYNIQFIGPKPIFIDTLSVRPYQPGEYWLGHRQFCEQFLNPLLLRALKGVPHNVWFRGGLEGISTRDLSRIISLRNKFSWRTLIHVVLQSNLEQGSLNSPKDAVQRVKGARRLSRAGYNGILTQLRNWIAKLQPADTGKTIWGDYAGSNTYSDDESSLKRKIVQDFAAAVKPTTFVDLGCNSGDFSVAALVGGATSVVGFDFDHRAVDLAFSRASENGLNFLPLWLDAANPSPDQGWRQAERKGFASRVKADAVVALAFEHHLVIGRNIPMSQAVAWIVAIAPVGIIEFVPKSDPTVQQMLALREDVFASYGEELFVASLETVARITQKQQVSSSGRTLFQFERK
ncbi:class I SAM-dependent methyltransferase [Mesorhizobium sp. B2-8-1]|nr:class I SAM-dependent methyltransferase [Mesorhizobium sp. B2-8-1]